MGSCKLEIETNYLKDIIKTLKIIDDGVVKFELSTTGMRCKSVDKEHITLIDMSVSRDSFNVFDYDCQEICLSILGIDGFIKSCPKNSVVTIEKTEDDKIIMSCGALKRIMSMESIEKEVSVPSVRQGAFVSFYSKILKDWMKLAKNSEVITIKLSNDLFEMFTKNDLDVVSLQLTNDDLYSKKLEECDKTYISHFDTERLNNFFKVIPNDFITLSVDNDFPLRVSYFMCKNKVLVEYLIAPRIEAD